MNTFLLAIVALGLVAFLMISRKKRAAAGSSPAESRSPGRSRRRKASPDTAPTPPMAAMAETAASRTLSPVMETPPMAPPAPPAAPSIHDWTPVEMIVEPGWPLPGEIAGDGSWPAAPAPAPEQPSHEPAPSLDTEPEPEPAASAEEWTMPAPDAEPAAAPAEAYVPEPVDAGEPAMEAWVPGVSEVEPIAVITPLPDVEPFAEPEPEPEAEASALVWAEPTPVEPDPVQPEAFEPEAVEPEFVEEPAPDLAGPPLWSPAAESDEPGYEEIAYEATIVADSGYEEPSQEDADAEAAPFEIPSFAQAPAEPAHVAEPAWEPAPPVPVADAADQSREIAGLLPGVVAGLSPLLAASDQLGVTPRMTIVLQSLADQPRGLPDLGRSLGVSRPVVADICARLQNLGLVGRERDAADRRRVLVVPTAKGLRLAGETTPRIDADELTGALAVLSPAERDALVSGVRALTESLRRPV